MGDKKAVRKAKKIYRDFQGREPEKKKEINLRSMKVLTFLGKGFAIEYETAKHKDRRPHIYRHEFDNECEVFTNGKDIIIHGDHITITQRGIEG